MKSPEQIADEQIELNYEDQGAPEEYSAVDNLNYLLQHGEVNADGIHALIAAAIEADRAQREFPMSDPVIELREWASSVSQFMAEDKSNDWFPEIAQLEAIEERLDGDER